MPAKTRIYRGSGTFRHAGSSDQGASLNSVRRSIIASPDEELSLTEQEDIAAEAEETCTKRKSRHVYMFLHDE
eukprot:673010-Hanusia_phi.AAC.1